MKKYTEPTVIVEYLTLEDIIATSQGNSGAGGDVGGGGETEW